MVQIILLLNALLQVEQKNVWSDSQNQSFATLKNTFTTTPILKLPDATKPFHLFFAYSLHVIFSCVPQQYDKKLHPVAYYSHKLKDAKTRYRSVERACLCIAKNVKK